MASPAVWAGPTSSSDTVRPPTCRSSCRSNVRVGRASGTSSKENGAKIFWTNWPAAPSESAERSRAAMVAGGSCSISSAQRAVAMISEPAQECVAVAVVAVGVGVDHRGDAAAGRGRGAHLLEHLGGEAQIEQRVHQQGAVVAGDQSGVGPAPAAVRLQVGPDAVGDFVQPLRVAHGRRTWRG